MKTILNQKQFGLVVQRLAHQLVEQNALQLSNLVIIGIQPRGIALAQRIYSYIQKELKITSVLYGNLDITFYRDDFNTGTELRIPDRTDIPFSIEEKYVVLIDDVLYTGRTIRSALDAILDFGRPAKVQLMVLIDRRFSRQLPIQADFVGKTIDSIISQKVKVCWQEKDKKDEVILIDND